MSIVYPLNIEVFPARVGAFHSLSRGIVELNEISCLQLADLEERAEELDKKRTSSIATVALINDRNRKANVSKAEVKYNFITIWRCELILLILHHNMSEDRSQD